MGNHETIMGCWARGCDCEQARSPITRGILLALGVCCLTGLGWDAIKLLIEKLKKDDRKKERAEKERKRKEERDREKAEREKEKEKEKEEKGEEEAEDKEDKEKKEKKEKK